MDTNASEHQKIIIDNAICKRRFHLVYEENQMAHEHVIVKCPHCSVTLFEHDNHAPVLLAREENLIHAPLGDVPIVYNCQFSAK